MSGLKRKKHGHDPGEHDLEKQLKAAADPVGFLLRDLEVVVDEAERPKIDHAEKGQTDKRVVGPRPEEGSEHNRTDNEHTAHRRSALFATVQLGQLAHFGGVTDRLADFQRNQLPNDVVAKEKRDGEGRDRRQDSAKGDVIENIEAFELLRQAMQKKHHDAQRLSIWRLANSSSTRSVRAERLPLTRTRSPGRAFSQSRSAATSAEETTVMFVRPAACAPAAISAEPWPSVMRRLMPNDAAVSPTSW